MMDKSVFSKDIDIPEVVQRKAEQAFLSVKKKENTLIKKQSSHNPDFVVKRFVSIAACLAVAAGIVMSAGFLRMPGSDDTTAAFTMHVSAAELKQGQAVPVVSVDRNSGHVIGGKESGDAVYYCINMPLTCEGENITDITYSVNQGAFQVVEPENNSIVINGTKYDGVMHAGIIGGSHEEAYESIANYYTSFTVAYDKQTDENTWINICNVVPMSQEDQRFMFGNAGEAEQYAESCRKMVEGVVITCTVNFADGSSQAVDITVGSKVMTYAEAGLKSDTPQAENVYMTFELPE